MSIGRCHGQARRHARLECSAFAVRAIGHGTDNFGVAIADNFTEGHTVTTRSITRPCRRSAYRVPPSPKRPQRPDDTASSTLAAVTPTETYERITVYVRPGQRGWLEDVLDREVRDASGKPIRSISASDIIRLAIDRLQGAVQEEGFPLLQELILAANKDAETFSGRKNRGLPKPNRRP